MKSLPLLYLLLLLPQTCLCLDDDPYYTDCTTLVFNCGSIRNVTYPFSGNGRPSFCGRQGFELTCQPDDDETYPVITIGAHEFRVLNITTGIVPTVRIARTDLWDGVCLQSLTNTTLDYTVFGNSASTRNLSLFYGCSGLDRSVPNNFTCEGHGGVGYFADEALLRIKLPPSEQLECGERMSVPVLTTSLDDLAAENATLEEALNKGFDLVYYSERRKCSVCETSGGVCGSNFSSSSSEFVCYCRRGHYSDYCHLLPGKSSQSMFSLFFFHLRHCPFQIG